jgi:hypothetical protein
MGPVRRLCILLALSFVVPSCTKKAEESSAPAPSAVAEHYAEDDSPLGEFRKKRKKRRKRRKLTASAVPSREEGQAALEEARQLLDEAEFRAAEAELKVAAAAGIASADELLFRVRSEVEAEDRIVRAHKEMTAANYTAARRELEQVPTGLLLSELAGQMLESVAQKEHAQRAAFSERAAQRLDPAAGADEAGEPAQAGEEQKDEAAQAGEEPKDEPAPADEEPKDEAAAAEPAPDEEPKPDEEAKAE